MLPNLTCRPPDHILVEPRSEATVVLECPQRAAVAEVQDCGDVCTDLTSEGYGENRKRGVPVGTSGAQDVSDVLATHDNTAGPKAPQAKVDSIVLQPVDDHVAITVGTDIALTEAGQCSSAHESKVLGEVMLPQTSPGDDATDMTLPKKRRL